MVRTRSMSAVVRSRNLIKTKAAPPKSKSKAAQPKSKRAAQLKRAAEAAAAAAAEEKKMMEAFQAVDVEKMLGLKKEAFEVMKTCFPMTARARLAEAEARARLAAARGQSVAEEEEEKKVPEKKKKAVKHLVPQVYIDRVKAGYFNLVDEIPEDKLAKESQLFRDTHCGQVLLNDKIQALQQFILDQYDAYGYAYDVEEVTDDEAEDDDQGIGAEGIGQEAK